MTRIINYIFIERLNKIQDIKLKTEIIKFKNEVLLLLDKNKFTKQYLSAFIDQYETDQLIKIQKLIDIELKKRATKSINNEL